MPPSPPAPALSSSTSCCTTSARRNRRLSNRRHKNCRQKNNCCDATLILLIFALSIQAAGFPMEFFAKDYKGMTKTVDNPKKVKTIFSLALPQEGPNQGGQILFKHTNNRSYVFIAIGHGVIKSAGGYVDLSSDKSSLLGKVIRVDINYSPGILPQPEVVAMGVGDPKGCSFDTNAMRFMYCSLVVNGTAQVRLIDIESGRYTLIYQGRLPKITGGFNYRASTDPSLEGRYIYIYNSNMCTAIETPEGSGHYDYTSARTTMIGCSASSPMACDPSSAAAIPGLVHFIGEDNNGDVLFFTTMGIYRLVHPALCHYPTVDGEPPVARAVGKDVGWPSWARVSFGVFSGGVGLVGTYVIWACVIKRVVFSGTNDGSGQEASSSCAMNNSCSCSNNTFNCMCAPM